jgi:hypothetical protein
MRQDGAVRVRLNLVLLATMAAIGLLAAGCSGSSGDASPPPSSTKFVVNPLEPGHGILQLGKNLYPFDGVICAKGPVPSDPKDTVRIFGVYANFKLDGSLVAVSMTRYESHPKGVAAVPTITETAQVQMQGKGEIKGLKAQRAQVIGQSQWGDIYDQSATGPLIVKTGDRYVAKGQFGPPDAGPLYVTGPTTTTTTLPGTSETTSGELSARCPAKSATTTTTTAAGSTTTGGSTVGSTAAGDTTVPAQTSVPPTSTAVTTAGAPSVPPPGAAPTAP